MKDSTATATTDSPKFTPSPYQQAVYADFEADSGATVIEAVAGSGKSTTVLEGVKYAPRGVRAVFLAFNKSIATELQSRVVRPHDARTFHSLGLLACRRAFGEVSIDETKTKSIATAVCLDRGWKLPSQGEDRAKWAGPLAGLAGLAKNTLSHTAEQVLNLGLAYDSFPDGASPEQFSEAAVEVLDLCAEQKTRIDFDDMVWFPARHGLRPQSHDLVIADEAQDLNAAQLYLAQATVRRDGRIVAVGDRRQAIYAFRGADSGAMERIVGELKARTLPLSISYRCPKSVQRLATEVVPQFEVPATAIEGSVVSGIEESILYRDAKPGDLVVSRTKAPLLSGALAMIARGIPAAVAGKDLGKKLAGYIDRFSKQGDDVESMLAYAQTHFAREVAKFQKLEMLEKAEESSDTFQAIVALSSGMTSVDEVARKIETLFVDGDPRARVLFSTTHKAKGLERDVVWMYGSTYRMWQGVDEQERNLYYVAVTRAKRDLRILGEVRR